MQGQIDLCESHSGGYTFGLLSAASPVGPGGVHGMEDGILSCQRSGPVVAAQRDPGSGQSNKGGQDGAPGLLHDQGAREYHREHLLPESWRRRFRPTAPPSVRTTASHQPTPQKTNGSGIVPHPYPAYGPSATRSLPTIRILYHMRMTARSYACRLRRTPEYWTVYRPSDSVDYLGRGYFTITSAIPAGRHSVEPHQYRVSVYRQSTDE
jgi:hypothetical protein